MVLRMFITAMLHKNFFFIAIFDLLYEIPYKPLERWILKFISLRFLNTN